MDGLTVEGVRSVLKRSGFHVREATDAGGTRFLYGDRHQYTKMATLLTHAGLVTFLIAAAVTSRLGDEQGLVVAVGDSLTVQPIGTPGLLLVKNYDFEAPGFDTGHPTDFTTDLAVFQDGTQIARKTIRVNDPLSVAGYTFHQNGFGPAPHLVLRSAAGAVLWDAPVPMTDTADGLPYASIGIPGRDMGLKLLLDKEADGTAVVVAIPYQVVGTGTDGEPIDDVYQPVDLHAGDTKVSQGLDLSIGVTDFGQFTLLIAKRDPGQGLVWIAFALLIAGITITFYRPRRRVWTRLAPEPLSPDPERPGGMAPLVVPVRWEIADDPAMRRVVQQGDADAAPEFAHSVHIECKGLEPGRDYWYRFTAAGEASLTGHTRTAPALGAPLGRLRFGFSSCANYEWGYFSAYRHLAAEAPDLVLFLGDYIYEFASRSDKRVRDHSDGVEATDLRTYRNRHAQYKTDVIDKQVALMQKRGIWKKPPR